MKEIADPEDLEIIEKSVIVDGQPQTRRCEKRYLGIEIGTGKRTHPRWEPETTAGELLVWNISSDTAEVITTTGHTHNI